MSHQHLRVIDDFLDFERARRRWEISPYDIRIIEEFPIAHGGGADVYRGRLRNSPNSEIEVAIKILRGTENEKWQMQKRLVREILVWSQLQHSNVLTFYGLMFGRAPIPGIVSAFVENDLMAYGLEHRDQRPQLVQQIAKGLSYLHSKYVIHGDVKPDNVRVSASGVVKILDFGIGRILHIRGFTTVMNINPRYAAPEILSTEDGRIRHTFHSDVFGFGMTMLQVLHGQDRVSETWDNSIPYNHIFQTTSLIGEVCRGERPKVDRYTNISEDEWRLIKHCWVHDPLYRPTMMKVVESLSALAA